MQSENPAPAKLPTIPVPILLATRNRHKTREIQAMLGEGVIVTDATMAADLPEIEETGVTFEDNSKLKAEGISPHGTGIVLADRKSTRLNSSHLGISYAVFCLKKQMNLRHIKKHVVSRYIESRRSIRSF